MLEIELGSLLTTKPSLVPPKKNYSKLTLLCPDYEQDLEKHLEANVDNSWILPVLNGMD